MLHPKWRATHVLQWALSTNQYKIDQQCMGTYVTSHRANALFNINMNPEKATRAMCMEAMYGEHDRWTVSGTT